MKLLEPSEATQDKLTSIGYGFFIPIFFSMTGGVKLNLRTLLTNPHALALIQYCSLLYYGKDYANAGLSAALQWAECICWRVPAGYDDHLGSANAAGRTQSACHYRDTVRCLCLGGSNCLHYCADRL